jgi:hypothetical protein
LYHDLRAHNEFRERIARILVVQREERLGRTTSERLANERLRAAEDSE